MEPINRVSGNFQINGVSVLDPQIPHKMEINTTGVYYRNMNATRQGYMVANMKKLYWAYKRLTKVELDHILNQILPVLQSGSDEFNITSYIDGLGVNTDLYYLGQPFSWEKDSPLTYKMEIHFIQVVGKKQL